MKYNSINAYVPITVGTIEEIVKDNRSFNPDRIRAIYHQCFMKRLSDSTNDKIRKKHYYKEGWVNLSSRILIKVATNNYTKYIDFMERLGLLEVRRNRVTGKKIYHGREYSIQYRIPFHLLHSSSGIRHFRKEKINDHKTLKALHGLKESFRNKKSQESITKDSIYEKLQKMLGGFSIDFNGAESFLDKVYEGEIPLEEEKANDLRYLQDSLMQVDAISEGLLDSCSVDVFGRRMHHCYSNLWKQLRKFVYKKENPDEQLVVLDIANSQPYHCSIAVDGEVIQQVIPEFALCVSKILPMKETEDYKLFSELCATGQIYEHWAGIRKLERNAAKKEIFRIMFSPIPNKEKKRSLADAIFQKHFPSVHKMFLVIKSFSEKDFPFITEVFTDKHGKFEGEKSYHKIISSMMQRLESQIILQRIAPKLIEQAVHFITVHDSFLVSIADEGRVMKVMETEYASLGITPPKIKPEPLIRKSISKTELV